MTLADLGLSILLAVLFLMTGAFKLSGQKRSVENFQRWKYPASVRLTGGLFETIGAILILIPSLALYGAVILLGVMLIAVYTPSCPGKDTKERHSTLVLLVNDNRHRPATRLNGYRAWRRPLQNIIPTMNTTIPR